MPDSAVVAAGSADRASMAGFTEHSLREVAMGLFDGLLGGVVGAEVTNLVTGVIQSHGGVQGLVAQFEKQGLGGVVGSWVGTGANQPISADQLHQVLGSDMVTQMAQKFGLNPQDLLQKLAANLPQAVDKLTPGGVVSKS
jgi:uncharacterized protein YidB (DUF937 family)